MDHVYTHLQADICISQSVLFFLSLFSIGPLLFFVSCQAKDPPDLFLIHIQNDCQFLKGKGESFVLFILRQLTNR